MALAVAGVALAAGATAAAMGSLTRLTCLANHHLKMPLLRCNTEDSGCSSDGGVDLLSQVRVHLSTATAAAARTAVATSTARHLDLLGLL